METLQLTDNAISHIAQLLQVAILTGTDVVDNLRAAKFVTNADGAIEVSPDYFETFTGNLQRMLEDAEGIQAAQEDTQE